MQITRDLYTLERWRHRMETSVARDSSSYSVAPRHIVYASAAVCRSRLPISALDAMARTVQPTVRPEVDHLERPQGWGRLRLGRTAGWKRTTRLDPRRLP